MYISWSSGAKKKWILRCFLKSKEELWLIGVGSYPESVQGEGKAKQGAFTAAHRSNEFIKSSFKCGSCHTSEQWSLRYFMVLAVLNLPHSLHRWPVVVCQPCGYITFETMTIRYAIAKLINLCDLRYWVKRMRTFCGFFILQDFKERYYLYRRINICWLLNIFNVIYLFLYLLPSRHWFFCKYMLR